MNFENGNVKPESLQAEWEGQLDVFSWLEFVCAIPHVLFVVTTKKENGLANASFQSWSSFTGEGENYFIIMFIKIRVFNYFHVTFPPELKEI